MPEPQLLRPPYLQKGDRIGIVSPARKISFEEITLLSRLPEMGP